MTRHQEYSTTYQRIAAEMAEMPEWKREFYNTYFATSAHAQKVTGGSMERLTGYAESTAVVMGARGKICSSVCLQRVMCEHCPIGDAIYKLAAYEDAGLTPEECVETKAELQAKEEIIKHLIIRGNEILKERDQYEAEVTRLAIESVEREKQLAKLEAEVQHWADAEASGRMVVLPIKPGTPVWVLEKMADHKTLFVRERFVNSYGISTDGYINMQLMVPEGAYPYPVGDIFVEPNKIGKTVFLAPEAAEAALEAAGKE